jgi:hypothetical protein
MAVEFPQLRWNLRNLFDPVELADLLVRPLIERPGGIAFDRTHGPRRDPTTAQNGELIAESPRPIKSVDGGAGSTTDRRGRSPEIGGGRPNSLSLQSSTCVDRAVPLDHLAGVGLNLIPTILAPDDKPDAGGAVAADCSTSCQPLPHLRSIA